MIRQKNYALTSASFNLTQDCNLACEYCFAGKKTKNKMTFETAKKCVNFLVDQCKNAKKEELNGGRKTISISFWGGEPLLEWELLKKIVLYTKSVTPKGTHIIFGGTTNGVLLTPEKFDFLEEHKIYFLVSLDGTAESHNLYRKTTNGKGSHEIIMKNMKEVLKKWPFYKARISLLSERIDHFYEDVKYLIDNKIYSIIFSPVYEGNWTDEKWDIFEEQSKKIVDLIYEYKQKGIKIHIEHFHSYCNLDASNWPCGAGRIYFGFDWDGSIWPCHRFNKFNDQRPWQEKETCMGHVDVGITKPEWRQKFIDFYPECGDCERLKDTPCHGGCYGVNFDFNGAINIPYKGLCKYTEKQKIVSNYYKEKLGVNSMSEQEQQRPQKSCVCYNMCYLEDTDDEIINYDPSNEFMCHCYNTSYEGDMDTEKVAKPLGNKKPMNIFQLNKKVEKIEQSLDKIANILEKLASK